MVFLELLKRFLPIFTEDNHRWLEFDKLLAGFEGYRMKLVENINKDKQLSKQTFMEHR